MPEFYPIIQRKWKKGDCGKPMKKPDARNAEINTWRPKSDDEIIVESEGQRFIVHFEKLFKGHDDKVKKLDDFIVKKPSFTEHLKVNSEYINYFINRYDSENDVVMGYFKMKYLLDEKKAFRLDNLQQFIDSIYGFFFSERLCEKIKQMVADNYLDNIESGENPYKSSKKYMKSLEFSNDHIQVLLRISMGMKMIAPIIYHYLLINHIRPTAVTEKSGENIIYYIYRPMFDLFTDPGMNIFNKLYVYIESKVSDSAYHNEKMFEQREILGDDPVLVAERFIKTRIIVDNMLKFRFNKVWNPKTGKYAENPLGLTKTIINQQLFYFRKETYGKTFTEMTNTRNSEGLSASDKMEMNLTKIDAGIIHMTNLNVDMVIPELRKRIDVPITDEEIGYYRDHLYPCDIQVQLIRSIMSDVLSSYRDMYMISRKDYNTLLLIIKKRLLLNAGYEGSGEFGKKTWLPYILTGNIDGRVINKPIRNAQLNEEIEADPIYQYLITVKYREWEEYKPGYIKEIIATLMNTKFTYVAYEAPELLGEPIVAPERELAAEILFFLKMI